MAVIHFKNLEEKCSKCNGTGEEEYVYFYKLTQREINVTRKCLCNKGKVLTEQGKVFIDFIKDWIPIDE